MHLETVSVISLPVSLNHHACVCGRRHKNIWQAELKKMQTLESELKDFVAYLEKQAKDQAERRKRSTPARCVRILAPA